MRLRNFKLFVEIADKGSLAAAARSLNISTTTASERLAALEEHFSTELIRRTTRSLSFTSAGQVLLDGARRLLADAAEIETQINHGTDALSGPIRMSLPTDLGHRFILPIVDRFLAENPEVRAEIILTDEVSDIIGMGLDFAIRDSVDVDPTLSARPLIPNDRVVIASPDYLDKNGAPNHPEDLTRHSCLLLRVGAQTNRYWRFVIDGSESRIALDGVRVTNDAGLLADWCRQSIGIAMKSRVNVEEDLRNGTLISILQDFLPPAGHFQVVHSASRALPRRVASLIGRIETDLNARTERQDTPRQESDALPRTQFATA